MFTFAIDYYLFTLAATIGVIQIAGSLGRLKGLLVFKSPPAAQSFGLVLVAAASVWFFTTDTRNVNDYEGGLDANIQALYFFLGAASAMAFTALASSILNARMVAGNRAWEAGLDALKYTTYVRALAHSLRTLLGSRRARIGSVVPPKAGLARVSLALTLVAVLLGGILALWRIGWSNSPATSVATNIPVAVEEIAEVDESIFLWINGWVGRFPAFDRIVDWVVSDYMVPVGLALTLIGLWFVGDNRVVRQTNQVGVMVALSAMGLASWAVYVMNGLYFRPRPFVDHDISLLFYQPTDSSFPANAAAATFAIAAAVWGVHRRAGTVMFVVAGLYGLARVYAGVHYPLDIIAGAAIGLVVALLVFRLKDLLDPLPSMVIKGARILCLA